MYYLAKVSDYIDRNANNDWFELTHNDIKLLTFANCTYSVVRALKNHYTFEEKTIRHEAEKILNGKIYRQTSYPKVYFNFRKKEQAK